MAEPNGLIGITQNDIIKHSDHYWNVNGWVWKRERNEYPAGRQG